MAERFVEQGADWYSSTVSSPEKRSAFKILEVAANGRYRRAERAAKFVDFDAPSLLQTAKNVFVACDEIIGLGSHMVKRNKADSSATSPLYLIYDRTIFMYDRNVT